MCSRNLSSRLPCKTRTFLKVPLSLPWQYVSGMFLEIEIATAFVPCVHRCTYLQRSTLIPVFLIASLA